MSKIIIGIHGLGNKPPEKLLKKWWKKSIKEGLRAIDHPRMFFKFEFVYWANFLHPEPLSPKIKDEDDPLFIENPYVPAKHFIKKKPSKIRQKILDYLEKQMDKLLLNEDMTINFSEVTDFIIHRYFHDLEIYYSSTFINTKGTEYLAREVIRKKLAQVLEKHQNKEIILIAHSMGSIIAYDVLTQTAPELCIDTFITIGSPLGLPIVISKIVSEQDKQFKSEKKVRTPENVLRNWFNFSDLEDKIAIDYSIAGDYEANSKQVRVIDKVINNNYEYNGHKNPHKSYGYLRAPELAEVINDFLNRDKTKVMIWLNDNFNKLWTTGSKQIILEKEEAKT